MADGVGALLAREGELVVRRHARDDEARLPVDAEDLVEEEPPGGVRTVLHEGGVERHPPGVYHALVDPAVERNLRPTALVARARSSSLDEWMRVFEVPLLLVRLDDPAGEMAQSLEGTREEGSSRAEAGMSFHTVSTEAARRRPASIPPPASFAPAQLLVRIIRACHFVVPAGKRADAGRVFSERVTIGRARNSDVVLRHESVSKFHAWLARDEKNNYFLADASSRNGTARNGMTLQGGDPVRLGNGDLLRFGSVEATYCDAATLYAALHD